jgi:iron complex transport system ATP-binding protein
MKNNRLEVKNITLTVGKKTICQGLNLSFRASERWGILGPNGVGKTTFLHALASLYPLAGGVICLNDQPLNNLTPQTIAKQIGILFQAVQDSFPQTVWEYCLASRFPHLSFLQKESQLDKQIVASALEKMQLNTLYKRSITALSGGERRRLAIASLLAQTPQIYLLDEPTNHLDMHHQRIVMEHFSNLAKKKSATLIMSLHDVNLAQQFCDFILLLFANGDVFHGPTHDILNTEYLTSLYQHPMMRMTEGSHTLWYPSSFHYNSE